jgi:hypothetical protein
MSDEKRQQTNLALLRGATSFQAPNNVVTYRLTTAGLDNIQQYFNVNPRTGLITVSRSLDSLPESEIVVSDSLRMVLSRRHGILLFVAVRGSVGWRQSSVDQPGDGGRHSSASTECNHS